MDDISIRVDQISKKYRIGQFHHGTLRGLVADRFNSLLKRDRSFPKDNEEIWALRDISFVVSRGEVVGVIGRNGAGKSTLLKILSRITYPTEGRFEINGRVGSLLEVGTGFHPELSGRENIYLNGAVIGMKRGEINRKFDEIVSFAEIEKFLDTPIKRYSSGMYVRLAFSVAAHLEPEILLVDEVLAVGDIAFQQKCLGKMGDVAREGRTVLFVSHNMSAIRNLCDRVILLRNGLMAMDGLADETVKEYLAYLSSNSESAFTNNPERSGDQRIRLLNAKILDENLNSTNHLTAGEKVNFIFEYANPDNIERANLVFTIYNNLGVAVTNFDMRLLDNSNIILSKEGQFICTIHKFPLPLGKYRVAAAIYQGGEIVDHIPNALVFTVDGSIFYKSGKSPQSQTCACMVDHEWDHINIKK